ncbi:MAG: peptidylprolyl isomerase [Lachnospiraceae bacterium]|nr:peptidylprolyl isomerase [Lachnospiraceae bacterium]
MKKKILSVLICGAMMVGMLAGCGNSQGSTTETGEAAESTETATGKITAEIDVQDYGVIKVELDSEAAPETVDNFVKLAKEGFYDGLTFHRIISGFMIQGGDPEGNGTGGSDTTIKGEFSNNGVDNPISHVRGTISMARSMEYDSASSQFFIVHEDSTFLDGDYAGFGTVTEGMEVVDAICEAVQVEDDNGTVAAENQPVINSVKIIE